MVSDITKTLIEGFDITRKGTVKLKLSSLKDPHIQKMINAIHTHYHIPVADLEKQLLEKLDRYQKLKDISEPLFHAAVDNAIEDAAFDHIEKVMDNPSYKPLRVEFDSKTFNQLIRLIQKDHSQFRNIRNPYKLRSIRNVSPVLVPSDNSAYTQYNKIPTAAATEDGVFIFNKNFMQKLLDFAVLDDLKPIGRKYQHNGGPIPDAYGYIEFLIMHEFLHYTYGDMHLWSRYGEYKKFSHKALNWSADFRINYQLVKKGYSQLPMGLFSSFINFDRQGSYKEMLDFVQKELDKLKDASPDVKDLVPEPHDEHVPAEPGDQSDDDDGSPEPDVDQDDLTKKTDEKMGDKEMPDEQNGEETEGPGGDSKDMDKDKDSKEGTQRTKMQKTGGKVDVYADAEPQLNWTNLMNLMLSSSREILSPSYAKPSPKTLQTFPLAAKTGAVAIKPASIKQNEPMLKVVIFIDTSGSMHSAIPGVIRETKAILKRLGKENCDICLAFFAGTAEYYKINYSRDEYQPFTDVAEIEKPMDRKKSKKGIAGLLSVRRTGGTEFTPAVYATLEGLLGKEYNVVIFSDNNMLWESNWPFITKIYKSFSSQFFFILDNLDTWRRCCRAIGALPKRWTALKL
jgi:hypothetical protein